MVTELGLIPSLSDGGQFPPLGFTATLVVIRPAPGYHGKPTLPLLQGVHALGRPPWATPSPLRWSSPNPTQLSTHMPLGALLLPASQRSPTTHPESWLRECAGRQPPQICFLGEQTIPKGNS